MCNTTVTSLRRNHSPCTSALPSWKLDCGCGIDSEAGKDNALRQLFWVCCPQTPRDPRDIFSGSHCQNYFNNNTKVFFCLIRWVDIGTDGAKAMTGRNVSAFVWIKVVVKQVALVCFLPHSHRRKMPVSFKNILDEAGTMLNIVKWLFNNMCKEPRNTHIKLVHTEV